jgi:biopolymer transport protein ExbB
VFFQGESGVTGDVVRIKGAELPRLWSERDGEVAALFSGEESLVPVDVTGGKARALQDIEGGAWDYVRKGGLWVWPIIALALVATVIGVLKLLSFAGYREPGETWVAAILSALDGGDTSRAVALAGDAKHPVGAVMARLVEAAGKSVDAVEETLYEQLMGVQQRAGALLPVLAVTAASAPLLGLLGTVSGMIRTFNLITLFGSGDPKPLAGGISEALVTTLFGLVVAIPALILHAFLSRRSQGIVQTTERLGLSFVNGLRKS